MSIKAQSITEIDGIEIVKHESVTKNIKSIKLSGEKLDTLIHTTALQCLAHAAAYGDVSLATELVKAMPKASRALALRVWFQDFGPLLWKENKKEGTQGFVVDKSPSKNAYQVAMANNTPFWEHTKEQEPKKLTLEQAIKSIYAQLDKLEKAAKGEKGELKDGEQPSKILAFSHVLKSAMSNIKEEQEQVTIPAFSESEEVVSEEQAA